MAYIAHTGTTLLGVYGECIGTRDNQEVSQLATSYFPHRVGTTPELVAHVQALVLYGAHSEGIFPKITLNLPLHGESF